MFVLQARTVTVHSCPTIQSKAFLNLAELLGFIL